VLSRHSSRRDRPCGDAIGAKSRQDLIEALEKTLGCPMLSERVLP
jgi:hypothetical protein